MATRVIAAQDKTSSGAGDDVQIKAGNANTSGAGGSIIIQPGAQATTGGNGLLIVRQPSGVAGTDEIQLSHDGGKGSVINKDGVLQLGGSHIALRTTANNAKTNLTAGTIYCDGLYSSNIINADGQTNDSYGWAIDGNGPNWNQGFNLRVGWSHIKGYANFGLAYTGDNTNGKKATLELTDGSTGGGAWAYRSSTTTVNTSYNDLNLAGHSAFQRLNATAATTITGIAPASTAGGGVSGQPTWVHTDGRVFWLYNVGTFNITIVNESASSTAGNRITTQTGANVVLGPGRMMQIVYDGTSSRWRTSGETYPYVFPTTDGTNGQVLTTNGSGTLSWTTVSAGASASGTTNYIAKFTGTSTLGNSLIFDNGTNVGIGTATPGAKLEIQTADGADALAMSGYKTMKWESNNHLVYGGYSAGQWQVLKFYTNGSERIRVDATGNVGIGTTSPLGRLDVVGANVYEPIRGITDSASNLESGSNNTLGLSVNNSNTTAGNGIAIGFNTATTNSTLYGVGAIGFNNLTHTTLGVPQGKFQVITRDSGGGLTPKLTIDTSGNVGIGTATPSNNLSIGASAGKIGFQRGSGDGESCTIGFKSTTGNDRYVFEINNTSGTGELRLNQGGTSTPIGMTFYTNNAEKMRIDSSGNVGIGTSSPQSTLDTRGLTILTNSGGNNYNENLRLPESTGGYSVIHMGGAVATSGTGANQWTLLKAGSGLSHRFEIRHNTSTVFSISTAGDVGVNTTSPGAKLQIDTGATGTKGQIIKAFLGQSANLSEWQNSSGTVNSWINSSGNEFSTNGINLTSYTTSYIKFDTSAHGLYRTNSWMGVGKGDFTTGFFIEASNYGRPNIRSAYPAGNGEDSIILNTTTSLVSSLSRIATFQNNGTTGAYILRDGDGVFSGVRVGTGASGTGNAILGGNSNSVNTGNYNTLIGWEALYNKVAGANNVALGADAGYFQADGSTALTTTNNSIYIGTLCRGFSNSDSNSIVIGYQAIGKGANTTVIGNSSTVSTDVFGTLTTTLGAAAQKGLVVKGAATQSANLTEWQDSTGTVVAAVSPTGAFTGSSFTPYGTFNSTTTIFGNNYWTPNYTGGVTSPSAGTYTKSSGSTGWNGQVYSSEGYTKNVYCSARPAQTNLTIMLGLNSDPSTDASYSSIDYAWYIRSDSILEIYENGSPVSTYGSYNTSTVLSITYDGSNVQYWKDGAIQRTVARSTGNPLYLDSSFYEVNASLNNVQFGPIGQPFGISGTAGYHPKFTSQQTLGNSLLYDDGTSLGIGTTTPSNVVSAGIYSNANTNNDSGFATSNTNAGTASRAVVAVGRAMSGGVYGIISYTGSGYTAGAGVYGGANNFQIWAANNASTMQIGTAGVTPLRFYTNNSERAVIDSSGNVGIGTNSPSYRLHVSGQTYLNNGTSNPLYIEQTVADGTTRDSIYLYEASAQGTGRQAISWYNGNTGYYKARIYTEVGSGYNATKFYIDTADNARTVATRLCISDGNVGINTTSPGAKLQVDTGATGTKGQIIKAFLGQSANLSEWQNSTGTVLSQVDPNGYFGVGYNGSMSAIGGYGYVMRTGGNILLPNNSSVGYVNAGGTIAAATIQYTSSDILNISNFQTGGVKFNINTADRFSITNSTATFTTLNTVGVETTGGANVSFYIKAGTSQTANLQEWRNNSGTALAYMDANGNFAAVTKSFLIPHPTPAKAAEGKKLRYASLEGPENGVYFRGRLEGENVIILPDYWVDLVDPDSITVNLTPRKYAQPSLFVVDANAERVTIESDRQVCCDFIVYATRKDIAKLEVEPDGN